jgi:2-polyprenyl-3-methyl-5-hydroxy-6-metoxy-1,4-benzoquinol methylase
MNQTFWNQMYSAADYAYGVEPNDFLTTVPFKANSKILCLAEGQGRNAVYLATQGHDVTMIDYSETGLHRAQELATIKGVAINTQLADLSDYRFEKEKWDAIVVIFGHFPSHIRNTIYTQIPDALKHDGKFVSETYSAEQIAFGTGGPKDPDMMPTEKELHEYFQSFNELSIQKIQRTIHEGSYHNGESSVIQVIAQKC